MTSLRKETKLFLKIGSPSFAAWNSFYGLGSPEAPRFDCLLFLIVALKVCQTLCVFVCVNVHKSLEIKGQLPEVVSFSSFFLLSLSMSFSLFHETVSHCNPNWSPPSAFSMLGLKACATLHTNFLSMKLDFLFLSPETQYVDQTGLQFSVILSIWLPKCWDHSHATACLC